MSRDFDEGIDKSCSTPLKPSSLEQEVGHSNKVSSERFNIHATGVWLAERR